MSKFPWVMRVELHLPTPEQMPQDILERAAAVSWVNFRVEGRGWLWLQANLNSAPDYMYLSQAKLRKTADNDRAFHPHVDTYNPTDELLISVTPNWEIFPPNLIGENEYYSDYRINVKEQSGKSCSECWQVWGEQLGEVERSGTLTTIE